MNTFEAEKVYRVLVPDWSCVDVSLSEGDCFFVFKADQEKDKYDILILTGEYKGKTDQTWISPVFDLFHTCIKEVSLEEKE